jgi:hypothetical protein
MLTIRRYDIAKPKGDELAADHLMPAGAELLSVAYMADRGRLVVYARIDDDRPLVIRRLGYYSNEWALPPNIGRFVGTASTGETVLHLFDEGERSLRRD